VRDLILSKEPEGLDTAEAGDQAAAPGDGDRVE